MAEFIEREATRNALRELCDKYNIGFGGEIKGFGSELAKLPDTLPADVRPERHGEWIYQEPDDKFSWKPYLCSACGEKGGKNYTEFCPHCGAKMDGKDGESDG